MLTTALSLLGLAAAGSAATIPKRGTSVSVTPHDQYSSSIGVLGCKIDTNRVAYWPMSPSCDDVCVKVTANGRSVYLLHIDQSGGAYDISYDAWNYLMVGQSATENPQAGGGLAAEYEFVGADECAANLAVEPSGLLAFSAANSMNFVTSCTATDSWVGNNFVLYNILNTQCTYGIDEVCEMPDPTVSNQPTCPSGLGSNAVLTTQPVTNILYPSGETAVAV